MRYAGRRVGRGRPALMRSLVQPSRRPVADRSARTRGGDIDIDGSGSGSARLGSRPARRQRCGAGLKDPKVAKKWLDAAKELVQKGDYFTAHKKPDDAKTQYENAVTAYREGDRSRRRCHREPLARARRGQARRAARRRTATTASSSTRSHRRNADVLKQAQAKLDDVTQKIGIVTFTVMPDGTTIADRRQEVGKTPLDEPLIFMPGTYTLTLSLVRLPAEGDRDQGRGGLGERAQDRARAGARCRGQAAHRRVRAPSPRRVAPKPVEAPDADRRRERGGALFTRDDCDGPHGALAVSNTAVDPTHLHEAGAAPTRNRLGAALGPPLATAADRLSVASAAFTAAWYVLQVSERADGAAPGARSRAKFPRST